MQYIGDVPEAATHETVKSETLANGSAKNSSSTITAPFNNTTSSTAAAAVAVSNDAAVAVTVQKDITRRRLQPPGGLAGGYTAATDLEGGQGKAAAIEARGSVSASSTKYFNYICVYMCVMKCKPCSSCSVCFETCAGGQLQLCLNNKWNAN
jgi:hypothetical protein